MRGRLRLRRPRSISLPCFGALPALFPKGSKGEGRGASRLCPADERGSDGASRTSWEHGRGDSGLLPEYGLGPGVCLVVVCRTVAGRFWRNGGGYFAYFFRVDDGALLGTSGFGMAFAAHLPTIRDAAGCWLRRGRLRRLGPGRQLRLAHGLLWRMLRFCYGAGGKLRSKLCASLVLQSQGRCLGCAFGRRGIGSSGARAGRGGANCPGGMAYGFCRYGGCGWWHAGGGLPGAAPAEHWRYAGADERGRGG